MADFKGGNSKELNLSSYYMGNRYAQAFSKGIKNNKMVKSINLTRNNLQDDGLVAIVDSIPDNIESLDLSQNEKITNRSYQRLGLLLDDPYKK